MLDKSVYIKLLTSPSYQKQLPPIEDINGLKTTQQKIQQHIEDLAELNKKFHKKQEQSFLIAFSSVMDKMAQQLLKAKRKYQDIDMQIRRHQICSKLEKQIIFYKRDNTELRSDLQASKQEVNRLRQKNQQLKSTVQALKNTLKNNPISINLDKTRDQKSRLSRMSMHNFVHDELQVYDLNKKTIAKIIDFRSQRRRAESNISKRGGDNTVVKTKILKESSCDIKNMNNEIRRLWKEFKIDYSDFQQTKSKLKSKIIDIFINTSKMKKLIKSSIMNCQNEE